MNIVFQFMMMSGEKKYLLYKGSEMPHIGELIRIYMDANRIYQSALARTMQRNYRTIIKYKKNPSLQAGILWELSHALKHNFFADLADALPVTFSRDSHDIADSKDIEIARLQTEIAHLQKEKELLLGIVDGMNK